MLKMNLKRVLQNVPSEDGFGKTFFSSPLPTPKTPLPSSFSPHFEPLFLPFFFLFYLSFVIDQSILVYNSLYQSISIYISQISLNLVLIPKNPHKHSTTLGNYCPNSSLSTSLYTILIPQTPLHKSHYYIATTNTHKHTNKHTQTHTQTHTNTHKHTLKAWQASPPLPYK
jgi:hypothetical protein